MSAAPTSSRAFWLFTVILLAAISATLAVLMMRQPPGPDLRPAAVVLPVAANMIGGDNDNYSAQMTEAITITLSHLGDINVASFSSALQVAATHASIHDTAAALRSRYVVEASVDDEASGILMSARVIDAMTDRQVWVGEYRGEREDVGGMAARIAADVHAAILAP